MIKKILLRFIFVYILIFAFFQTVDAGVCSGSDIDSYYGTCSSQTVYIKVPDYLNVAFNGKTNYGYFLRPGYQANISNIGGAPAFCLDPALKRPPDDTSLNLIREIDNSSADSSKLGDTPYYDAGVYRMYQHFYNNLIYSRNNGGLSDNIVNLQRSFFQVALRIWTYKNNFSYLENNSAHYTGDASLFKQCAEYIINPGSKDSNNFTRTQCYGDLNYNLSAIQGYYDSLGKNYIWENPIEIKTSSLKFSGQDGKDYYRYIFDISFANDKYSFFDGTLSSGIDYRDIQLGKAEFYLNNFVINGEKVCNSSEVCYNYSGGGIVSEGTSRQFMVELSEEQFNEYKDKNGEVSVTMEYGYQHPLNIENLYTARYDLYNSFQRMLIIRNYIHQDSVTIGKVDSKTSFTPNCKHTTNADFTDSNGKKVSTLSDFIDSCNCFSVNKELLTPSQLEIYNTRCSSGILEEKYEGNLEDCNKDIENYDKAESDSNFSSYYLKYSKITQINDYCTETCVEDVQIKDLKGKYTTTAGTYFNFSRYPSLSANKTCTVKIDIDKWNGDYEKNLELIKNKYNEWKKAKAANESQKIVYNDPSCGSYCCMGYDYHNKCKGWCNNPKYVYNNSYDEAVIVNSTDIDFVSQNVSASQCNNPINWNVYDKLKEFQSLSSLTTSLSNLKSYLKVCNNRFLNSNDDKSFYDFTYDMKYYYSQTFADKKIGTIKNNERTSYGGINDSDFEKESNITGSLVGSGGNKDYANLTESGVTKEPIYTYTSDIIRSVQYNIKYSRPKYYKNLEIFTGKIITENPKGKYIKLGYVYDTDVTAIPKNDNENYYEFITLGSDDNKVFSHFKDGKTNTIRRYCIYEIKNDVFCPNGDCNKNCSGNSCNNAKQEPQYVFRIVDSNNIDPNNRLLNSSGNIKVQTEDNGFRNWRNDKGIATKTKIENTDTYNPENLEYSFTLDSATMKAIREYNANCDGNECDPISYSDTLSSYSELKCDENEYGRKCTSEFITTATSSSSIFGKAFATNTDGRKNWKAYECTDGKSKIGGEEVKNVTCTSSSS